MNKITEDEWLAELENYFIPEGKPGPEWFTANEVAIKLKKPESTIRHALLREYRNGELERAERIYNSRITLFYRKRGRK